MAPHHQTASMKLWLSTAKRSHKTKARWMLLSTTMPKSEASRYPEKMVRSTACCQEDCHQRAIMMWSISPMQNYRNPSRRWRTTVHVAQIISHHHFWRTSDQQPSTNFSGYSTYHSEAVRATPIIPLLKSGKPASDLAYFRPISLTSCMAKVLEWMLAERLYYIGESQGLFSNLQYGLKNGRSCEDQILKLSQAI